MKKERIPPRARVSDFFFFWGGGGGGGGVKGITTFSVAVAVCIEAVDWCRHYPLSLSLSFLNVTKFIVLWMCAFWASTSLLAYAPIQCIQKKVQ